jgi:hypothetical protein
MIDNVELLCDRVLNIPLCRSGNTLKVESVALSWVVTGAVECLQCPALFSGTRLVIVVNEGGCSGVAKCELRRKDN